MNDSNKFRLRNVSASFIDEISMLTAKQLAYMNMALMYNTKVYNKFFWR